MTRSVNTNHKVAGDKSLAVSKLPEAVRDERAAVEFLEQTRWGNSPYCPRCGIDDVRQMLGKDGKRNARFLWRCYGCHTQFTVRIGTVMEDSRIPFRFWVHAFWRACASKKGVSALQIKRETGLSYNSALFLMHRVRWAMTDSKPGKLMGLVEVDETWVGGRVRGKGKGAKLENKTPVLAMVERHGRVRAMPLTRVTSETLKPAIFEHVHRSSALMTDEHPGYPGIANFFDGHITVNHSEGEYVRGVAYTNTVEGFFALLKRGIMGTFHSVSKRHLHRYVTEFEFRYNNRSVDDGERTQRAIKGGEWKRLRYKEPKS